MHRTGNTTRHLHMLAVTKTQTRSSDTGATTHRHAPAHACSQLGEPGAQTQVQQLKDMYLHMLAIIKADQELRH
eukprot:1681046-Lingulodinium_polyedra.AAC.2